MKNKIFLLLALLITILSLNFVSAYYSSYDLYNDDYYYKPKVGYEKDNYKDTEEYTRTTTSSYSDPWESEKTTTTITEKTTYQKTTKTPVYYNKYYANEYDYRSFNGGNYFRNRQDYWNNNRYEDSNWRHKEDYCSGRLDTCFKSYDDYYYKPRYDSQNNYYNWRW